VLRNFVGVDVNKIVGFIVGSFDDVFVGKVLINFVGKAVGNKVSFKVGELDVSKAVGSNVGNVDDSFRGESVGDTLGMIVVVVGIASDETLMFLIKPPAVSPVLPNAETLVEASNVYVSCGACKLACRFSIDQLHWSETTEYR